LPPVVVRRSRAVTALVAAAVAVACLVVVGIGAAIAIPVFLSQRMKAEWRSTTITLPETFDGGTRTEVPASLVPQLPSEVASQLHIAFYRTGAGATILVAAAKAPEPLSAEDQVTARREVLAGVAGTGSGVTLSLTETDAGELGGWFGCGTPSTGRGSACLATDSSGLVMVLLEGSPDPVADARRMREAVVHR
jgi:hypothetical protein